MSEAVKKRNTSARITMKHDTEANWLKAKETLDSDGFVPLVSELIVYEAETWDTNKDGTGRVEPIAYPRIKIGDGHTNVNSLPFLHGVGVDTENGGEIFGDYVNNTASLKGHAEGEHTKAGWRSHSEGYLTEAGLATINGGTAHAQGRLTRAMTKGSHASGLEFNTDYKDASGKTLYVLTTTEIPIDSTEVFYDTLPSEGFQVGDAIYIASGESADNEITATDAKIITSVDLENKKLTVHSMFLANNYPSSDWSVDGSKIPVGSRIKRVIRTTANGLGAHAMGRGAVASNIAAMSFGTNTSSTGENSFSINHCTEAAGKYSFSGGTGSSSTGQGAFSFGSSAVAAGNYAFSLGFNTVASGKMSLVIGKNNKIDTVDSSGLGSNAFIIGNGSSNSNSGRKNALEVTWAGAGKFANKVTVGANATSDMDLLPLGQFNDLVSNFIDNDSLSTYLSVGGYITDEALGKKGYLTSSSLSSYAKTSALAAKFTTKKTLQDTTVSQGVEIGNNASARANYTVVAGYATDAVGTKQFVFGQNNALDPRPSGINSGNGMYIQIVGNGTGNANRTNAYTLDWNGNATFAGNLYIGSTEYDNSGNFSSENYKGRRVIATGDYLSELEENADSIHVTRTQATKWTDDIDSIQSYVQSLATQESVDSLGTDVAALGGTVDTITGNIDIWWSNTNEEFEVLRSDMYSAIEEVNMSISSIPGQKQESGGETFNDINNVATGEKSHAEGGNTQALASSAHAEGQGCVAGTEIEVPIYDDYGEIIGYQFEGSCSHAEGYNTQALANCAHAEGNSTIARTRRSHAEGYGTETSATVREQHVQGRWNVPMDSSSVTGYEYAHILGNGSKSGGRSTCHTIDFGGNAWFAGNIYVGGTNQDDTNAKRLPMIHSGTTEPDDSLGQDGDIYILYE